MQRYLCDIEDHLKHDTKAVIIDAGAIGSIDITGADSIEVTLPLTETKRCKAIHNRAHCRAQRATQESAGLGLFN